MIIIKIMTQYVVFCIFKLFEIVLFLFPAFPSEFYVRVWIMIIYVIGHILGVQTQYKLWKQSTLDIFSNSHLHLEQEKEI